MTIMNPGFIQGPSFHKNQFTSSDFIIRALKNDIPGIPKISLAFVDVRDAALGHVLALEKSNETDGKRYILVENSYWMEDTLTMLREEFSKFGYKITDFTIGKTMFTIVSWFDA